ncbi:MAG: SH3 domain-containing protein [Chloroflexi bacterium]|nr:SH3 domain-containing protein [Chloroflexota bacterium]
MNLRAGPGDTCPILRKLNPDSLLEILGRDAYCEWINVRVLSTGESGWVWAEFAEIPVFCTVLPRVASSPCPTPVPPPSLAAKGNCHPSYPDVCIPPPPPDLDCKDIPFRRFRVLPPDPHRFDGDKDGIGCEW